MRAILEDSDGRLLWAATADPSPAPDEVVIEVAATAVNRADLGQRQGLYPPPPGESPILGLECSGVIAELGSAVQGWSIGDRVCALLSGGGYAERVAVPATQLLPIPVGMTFVEAASLPEAVCTVWSNLAMGFRDPMPGEVALIHGGASGLGSMAVQLAARAGYSVIATAGSLERARAAQSWGATRGIDYRTEDFVAVVAELTAGRGVNVILDVVGGSYLERNLASLADDGRLMVVGLMGGSEATLDFRSIMARRLSVHATTLRARPRTGPSSKAEVVASVRADVWPWFESGELRAAVGTVMPITKAEQAHREIADGTARPGKTVLEMPSAVSRSAR
ncbi:NADPH2:quinone reductase [Microterricola gilva]|uniref:NADPH2:quinone reductase n=1 Tax=Microterricola gilva TaxID=393267 RepID=A0A4Q8AMW3_9MICO|nr:NAD(P)H-quinone oxidoreductase [Microterricola gilva]RZU65848.1 NADPH2:quinone reductase [Microterricola gilva]